MTLGEKIDGALGMRIPQALLVLLLIIVSFVAIGAGGVGIIPIFAIIFAWYLGIAFGKRKLYREIGQQS